MPDPSKVYRVLMLIGSPELASKAESLLEENGLPVMYHVKAQGTASSDIMNTLGLTPEKTMIGTMISQRDSSAMLKLFRRRLYLGMPNTGIAFTIPVSGGTKRLFSLVDGTGSNEGNESMADEDRDSCMIIAIVNQGSSDDVMKVARPAGATGGTVFHSRRVGEEKAMKWGISIQEEREIVMILARNSRKKEIMEAINTSCGIDSDCNGVVFSVPIADIEGIG